MPRSPSVVAHEKVLRAAFDLFVERGVEGSSMDAIAAASGVSKATVYKHWRNKEALLIDVIRSYAGDLPEFDTGNPRADLVELLRYIALFRKSAELERLRLLVLSYAMTNPRFVSVLREETAGPRRNQLARILGQAADAGDLRAGIDIDLAADLLIGPIVHRRFLDDRDVPPELPERVVDCFWRWAQAANSR